MLPYVAHSDCPALVLHLGVRDPSGSTLPRFPVPSRFGGARPGGIPALVPHIRRGHPMFGTEKLKRKITAPVQQTAVLAIFALVVAVIALLTAVSHAR